jgi:basic amino acid/polyamine antiporter, APA family
MTKPVVPLRRRLNLALLTLYGIGVTIGAGIYVLIGPVAAHAGPGAPLAFLLAAIVMALTVCSYAELCTHFPVAASEAAYVKAAFHHRAVSTFTGLLMIAAGVIAGAAVTIGSAGYIAEFIDLPRPVLIALVVLALGAVTAWGVLESVLLASLFTIIEVGGLIAIIVAAGQAQVPIGATLLSVPSGDWASASGILFASVLAFFAFTGFENTANMAEEVHAPERNVPIAMAITLLVTTVLYILIAAIAVTAVPIEQLAASPAPLSLVYRQVAGIGPAAISAVAIVATLNTIIAQMTMATRVIYGMARQHDLPHVLGTVSHVTGTPLLATGLSAAAVLLLAWFAPLEKLAEYTSIVTLAVFALVNLSLLKLRRTSLRIRRSHIRLPIAIPILGLITSLLMIASALFAG